ncbi:MucR family transcriptional regulator [Mesorhizobium sp. LHD-90]|uniref:MucR family transcriptional regulator n=1 Tax=Mesorhizobium sp. LHD-90 TaxID=3071414 RepID=UPI0027DFAE87|nr:MucR family transcriptional regulator [Mesorhizobium sp. LHD-90]MDQ6436228.1 MucR family transcriptional regulator [Mesorhizobium sp. LHD-90]
MTEQTQRGYLIDITAEIVSAYVSHNAVPISHLPGLISDIHNTLHRLLPVEAPPAPEVLTPAVPIKKSIQGDFLICLEDGKKFTSLKRHLFAAFGLSPEDYRRKWGLPPDYPMVAPNYAARRSELAKSMGLGRKATEAPAPAQKRGRRKAAQPA